MNRSLRNKDASGVYFPALGWGSASPWGDIGDRILLDPTHGFGPCMVKLSVPGQDSKFRLEKEEERETGSPALSHKPVGRRMKSAAGFPPSPQQFPSDSR